LAKSQSTDILDDLDAVRAERFDEIYTDDGHQQKAASAFGLNFVIIK
jgi:hypothetical protein